MFCRLFGIKPAGPIMSYFLLDPEASMKFE